VTTYTATLAKFAVARAIVRWCGLRRVLLAIRSDGSRLVVRELVTVRALRRIPEPAGEGSGRSQPFLRPRVHRPASLKSSSAFFLARRYTSVAPAGPAIAPSRVVRDATAWTSCRQRWSSFPSNSTCEPAARNRRSFARSA